MGTIKEVFAKIIWQDGFKLSRWLDRECQAMWLNFRGVADLNLVQAPQSKQLLVIGKDSISCHAIVGILVLVFLGN